MTQGKGEYLVLWHMGVKQAKRGFWNGLLGKKTQRVRPIIHRYDTAEVAEYGFRNLKSKGGYRPLLLKVIKE